MGGTCSTRRGRALWREEEEARQHRRRMATKLSRRRSLRHSVDSAIPDNSVSKLYPVHDNYVNEDDGRRSPKSLSALCVDAVCRSLPSLDGELPAGLPQDVVDDLSFSLREHAALNATTLRVLRNCELGKLVLSGCRGVTDEWLEPLGKTTISMSSLELPEPDRMELSFPKKPQPECAYRSFGYVKSQDDDSSRSTSSFVSANSRLEEPEIEPIIGNEVASLAAMTATEGNPPMEDVMIDDSFHFSSYGDLPPEFSSPMANLTELDLRGSQRLTDKGLLQLKDLCQLEVARLDNCHALVGRGILALSLSHRLHTLSLSGCRRLTDEAIINLAHIDSLESLNLEGCRCLTNRSLLALAGLFRLRKLDLSQCDLITDAGLKHLSDVEALSELSLGWCRSITDQGIETITLQAGRPEFLRILRLARCTISGYGVGHLTRLLALEELDLNGCSSIGSAALGRTLERLPNLQTLDVSYCPGILRTSWQGKIPSLRTLDLCYSRVTDGHLSTFSHLPCLESINLDSCLVGDWAVAHLAENNVVPNLKSLDLADVELTDRGMVHLSKFHYLKRLSLFYCNISNRGLQYIAQLTDLEELNLDSREISDSGLRHLRKLRKLRSLDVFSGRITDAGCTHIASIKSLEALELCGGGVGDLGCTLLSGLENLTSLNLSQNERITNRGASALSALKALKALNLSNTRVDTSGNLRLPASLQSLALYGCSGIEDDTGMSLLQMNLPRLKCLRLNQHSNQDGVMFGMSNAESQMDTSNSSQGFAPAARFHAGEVAYAGEGTDSEDDAMEANDEDDSDYSEHD